MKELVKLIGGLGPNGPIITTLWLLTVFVKLSSDLPASEAFPWASSFFQHLFLTVAAIVSILFVTWNFFGWPPRLAGDKTQ